MGRKSTRKGPPETRFHRHVLPGGWAVLAGRSEADNDRLSWLLYRKSITFPIKLDSVILWVKAQEQVATVD